MRQWLMFGNHRFYRLRQSMSAEMYPYRQGQREMRKRSSARKRRRGWA
jgi:hypothetical protein